MEDCYPAIPNGVQKRPPFEWKAQLKKHSGAAIPADPYALFIDIPRGDLSLDLTLMLTREGGHVKAYLFQTATWANLLDVPISTAAQTYLDTNAPFPQRDLRARPIEDTTFITNRTVPTAVASGTIATRPFEALVWCKLHGYARKTTVTVLSSAIGGGSLTAGFTSGSGSNSNDPLTVGTDKLAAALYSGTDPKPGNDTVFGTPLSNLSASGFTTSLSGSLIYIYHPTVDFQLVISDDVGGTGVIPVKGTVQRFSDLPEVASDGFTVRIANEDVGGNSDYYVQHTVSSSNVNGVWKEVIAPGAAVGLDPTTMPVGLVFDSGGVGWNIRELPWKQRLVGDANLSPDPEFVGSTINDVGWWRGRLGLISNGQVNISASDDPFKFYTTTLITQVDSDPIGLLTPVDIKTFFKEAVIFDQRFLVMGNKGQAIISAAASRGAPTPSTTLIEPLSKSEYTDQVLTQGANHKIYFAAIRKAFMSIFEIGIDRLSGLALPEDMTPAVPRYIPATLDRAGTFESDFVTVRGSSGSPRMFVHMFRHAEQQRVQNAHHAWNLPSGFTLQGLYVKNSVVYVAVGDASGNCHALELNLQQLALDDGVATVLTYADLKIPDTSLAAPTYNSTAHTTTFTLPYPVGPLVGASVREPGTEAYPEGYTPTVASRTSSTVTLQGDWRTVPLYFGYKFASYFIPSQFYVRGQDGKPNRSGRLNVNRVRCDLATFSYLRAEVTVLGRATRLLEFNGLAADDPGIGAGAPADQTRTVIFTVPVGGKSEAVEIKLVNDTFLGFALLGYEWEGIWNPKAQRVT